MPVLIVMPTEKYMALKLIPRTTLPSYFCAVIAYTVGIPRYFSNALKPFHIRYSSDCSVAIVREVLRYVTGY